MLCGQAPHRCLIPVVFKVDSLLVACGLAEESRFLGVGFVSPDVAGSRGQAV